MVRSILRRAAQVVLVALTLGGALAFGAQVTTWPDHPLADMTHVTHWVTNIREGGQEIAYAGTYPDTYMIYPPGMTYAYQAAAWLAEHVAPPLWLPGLPPQMTADEWLRVCVKLVPDFTPPAVLWAVRLLEASVEKIPGLNVFCAHNVVVGRKRA